MRFARSRRRMAALAVVATVIAGCAGSSNTPRVEPTVSIPPRSNAPIDEDRGLDVEPAPAELQTTFDDLVAGVDGGAVAAVRVAGGPLHLLATGTEPDGAPLAEDAVVRVGSISKVVTATLVLGLAQDGLVDLDATVGSVLPETSVGGDVTVRELLAHRSGIPNYTDNPGFFEAVLRRPSRRVTPEQVFGFVDPDEVLFAPGAEFSYSNTNYVLLGLIIEAASGQSLNEVFDARIGHRLDLVSTGFDLGDRLDVAHGHTTAAPGGSTDFDYTSVASSAWAAGSLVTTVEELARLATALFAGELIGPEGIAEMRAPLEAGEEYGLGLHAGPDFGVGHGGAILGFNSMLQVDPGAGDLLVLVVNNDLRRPEVITAPVWDAATGG